MHTFKIAVEYHKTTDHIKWVTDGPITGHINIKTNRCNLPAVLASLNVARYRIDACDYAGHVMDDFKAVPDYYFKED